MVYPQGIRKFQEAINKKVFEAAASRTKVKTENASCAHSGNSAGAADFGKRRKNESGY
jgi:hypothetical protein